MNSYKLVSKLKKARADAYLTPIDQALYHELVSICNEKGWKDVFEVKNSQLCANLNISEKTLIKSRQALSSSELIHFKTCKDKRIGCYYSFSPVVLPELSTGIFPVDVTVDSSADVTGEIICPEEEVKVLSPVLSAGVFPDDIKRSPELLAGVFPDEMPFSPYNIFKTINKEGDIAHARDNTSPKKPKKSRKKEGDEKPLVYPFTSEAFMSAWEMLRQTPKWKKKLNYALQLSLNKLSEFEEEFAIHQIKRAIESDWTGVVFTGTKKDYQEWLNQKYGNVQKNNSGSKPKTAGIKSISF